MTDIIKVTETYIEKAAQMNSLPFSNVKAWTTFWAYVGLVDDFFTVVL